MNCESFDKLVKWKDGHLTELGVSILLDDEVPAKEAFVMREHMGKCESCKAILKRFLTVERFFNPEK